jgi:hypothetical protein
MAEFDQLHVLRIKLPDDPGHQGLHLLTLGFVRKLPSVLDLLVERLDGGFVLERAQRHNARSGRAAVSPPAVPRAEEVDAQVQHDAREPTLLVPAPRWIGRGLQLDPDQRVGDDVFGVLPRERAAHARQQQAFVTPAIARENLMQTPRLHPRPHRHGNLQIRPLPIRRRRTSIAEGTPIVWAMRAFFERCLTSGGIRHAVMTDKKVPPVVEPSLDVQQPGRASASVTRVLTLNRRFR